MQTFRLVYTDRKLVALGMSGGYQTSDLPPQHTFKTLAKIFLFYIQQHHWRNKLQQSDFSQTSRTLPSVSRGFANLKK